MMKNNLDEKFHTVEEIAPNTYRIDELGIANSYLVLGEQRALLIDTGCGVGNIKAAIEELTSLPIDVVLTHAHCDHAGGVSWFERYFVHESDTAFIYKILSSRLAAKTLAGKIAPKGSLNLCKHHSKQIAIKDGHHFDLGGRMVTVIHTPGHTKGSIILLDDMHKLMFTGDNANRFLWMQLPGCTSLSDWLVGAEQILSYTKEYRAYCGHEKSIQTNEQIQTTLNLVRELLAQKQKKTFLPKTKTYPNKTARIQVVYKRCD